MLVLQRSERVSGVGTGADRPVWRRGERRQPVQGVAEDDQGAVAPVLEEGEEKDAEDDEGTIYTFICIICIS